MPTLHHFNTILSAKIEIARLISFSFMRFVSHLFQSYLVRTRITVYSSHCIFQLFCLCLFTALDNVSIISLVDKQISKKPQQSQMRRADENNEKMPIIDDSLKEMRWWWSEKRSTKNFAQHESWLHLRLNFDDPFFSDKLRCQFNKAP